MLFYNSEAEVAIGLHVDDFHVTGPQQVMSHFSELAKHLRISVSNYFWAELE